MYWIPNGAISEENWAVEVLNTRCRELFFRGQSIYNEAVEWSLKVIRDLGIEECVRQSDFLSYDVLLENYFEKCELFLELPQNLRSFSQIQGGSVACDKCNYEDCIYAPCEPTVLCERCSHCRSRTVQCGMFYGCMYCETESETIS